MAKTVQITFDAADPGALASFWQEVLGYVRQPPPEGFDSWEEALGAFGVPDELWNSRAALIVPDGAGPRVFIQQVPEGKSAKNRVHLDVRTAPNLVGEERMATLEAECDRLVALGGTKLYRVEPDPPMENGFIESFNGKLRDECLNEEWFVDLDDAKTKIEAWRINYNDERPHSALEQRTPTEFARRFTATGP